MSDNPELLVPGKLYKYTSYAGSQVPLLKLAAHGERTQFLPVWNRTANRHHVLLLVPGDMFLVVEPGNLVRPISYKGYDCTASAEPDMYLYHILYKDADYYISFRAECHRSFERLT